MKQMCINQGYVPKDCKFPENGGMLLFILVKEGKNPCVGCNINCKHAKKEGKQNEKT